MSSMTTLGTKSNKPASWHQIVPHAATRCLKWETEKPNATKSSCQPLWNLSNDVNDVVFFCHRIWLEPDNPGTQDQYLNIISLTKTRITGLCWSKKWSSVPSPCWHCPCWRPPATMDQVRWWHGSQTIGCFSGKHDPLSNNGSREDWWLEFMIFRFSGRVNW